MECTALAFHRSRDETWIRLSKRFEVTGMREISKMVVGNTERGWAPDHINVTWCGCATAPASGRGYNT